jgi:hypothetical protein
MMLAHLVHLVRPQHDRWTASMDRWLLTKKERAEGVYTAFVDASFMSPAMKDKAEYRKIALGGAGSPAWLTPNEVRGHDELPPLPGGNNLYSPTNAGPIDKNGIPQVSEQPKTDVNVPETTGKDDE